MTNTISRERSEAIENTTVEVGKIGINVIGITSLMIGCWAVVSLVAGMISSGGPFGLVANFVKAVIGQ